MAIILQSLFLTIPAILRALPMLAAALALWIGGAYLAAMNVRFTPFFTALMLGIAHCSLVVTRGALILKGGAGPLRRGRLADAASTFQFAKMIAFAGSTSVLFSLMEKQGLYPKGLLRAGIGALGEAITASSLLLAASAACMMLVVGFSSALLVPMAAAAAGKDESGQQHSYLWGFGAHLAPLFLLNAGLAATVVLGPAGPALYRLAVGFFHFVAGPRAASAPRTPGLSDPVQSGDWLMLLIVTLLLAWIYTAAAMAFLARQNQITDKRKAERALNQVSSSDLRDLRKRRQQ